MCDRFVICTMDGLAQGTLEELRQTFGDDSADA